MITTKQVRAVMRKHGKQMLFTNKTSGDTTRCRRVKCYNFDSDNYQMLRELISLVGHHNIRETGDGIIVRCFKG